MRCHRERKNQISLHHIVQDHPITMTNLREETHARPLALWPRAIDGPGPVLRIHFYDVLCDLTRNRATVKNERPSVTATKYVKGRVLIGFAHGLVVVCVPAVKAAPPARHMRVADGRAGGGAGIVEGWKWWWCRH